MTGPFFKRHYNQIRSGWYFNRSWDKVYLHYVAIFSRHGIFLFREYLSNKTDILRKVKKKLDLPKSKKKTGKNTFS